jgi:hypothetical protein
MIKESRLNEAEIKLDHYCSDSQVSVKMKEVYLFILYLVSKLLLRKTASATYLKDFLDKSLNLTFYQYQHFGNYSRSHVQDLTMDQNNYFIMKDYKVDNHNKTSNHMVTLSSSFGIILTEVVPYLAGLDISDAAPNHNQP